VTSFRPEYQVKQFVAVVQGEHGRFMVLATGSDRHYLFCQLDPSGCQTGLQFPVLRADLQPDIRAALAHGWGNADLQQLRQADG
jgi:hypothetical protein